MANGKAGRPKKPNTVKKATLTKQQRLWADALLETNKTIKARQTKVEKIRASYAKAKAEIDKIEAEIARLTKVSKALEDNLVATPKPPEWKEYNKLLEKLVEGVREAQVHHPISQWTSNPNVNQPNYNSWWYLYNGSSSINYPSWSTICANQSNFSLPTVTSVDINNPDVLYNGSSTATATATATATVNACTTLCTSSVQETRVESAPDVTKDTDLDKIKAEIAPKIIAELSKYGFWDDEQQIP